MCRGFYCFAATTMFEIFSYVFWLTPKAYVWCTRVAYNPMLDWAYIQNTCTTHAAIDSSIIDRFNLVWWISSVNVASNAKHKKVNVLFDEKKTKIGLNHWHRICDVRYHARALSLFDGAANKEKIIGKINPSNHIFHMYNKITNIITYGLSAATMDDT